MKYVPALLILLLLASTVSAMSVGVSPPRIVEEHAKPGLSWTETIMISKSANLPLGATVTVKGDVADWIAHPEELSLSPDMQTEEVNISISLPSNVPLGTYEGELEYFFQGEDNVHLVFPVDVRITITEADIISYEARAFTAEQVSGTTTVAFMLYNNGNVATEPSSASVTIYNNLQSQTVFTDDVRIDPLAPFSEGQRSFAVATGLPQGVYWMNVTFPTGKQELFVLEVEEQYTPPVKESASTLWVTLLAVVIVALLLWYWKKSS